MGAIVASPAIGVRWASLEHIHSALCAAIRELRLVTFTLDGFDALREPHDYGIVGGKTKLFC